MQPTPLATAVRQDLSARRNDGNGFFSVADNPLSKTGVFEYLGSELPGAPDPARVYRVYRPAEELADPECIASFQMVPLVDEHTWLGDGGTPAEQKGVHGATGESVHFDGQYLRGTLKIFSRSMADAIAGGKRELSAGYRCAYDWAAGVWDGLEYDVIQRQIRGNHVALVTAGRMGPDVAVLDHHLPIAFDSMEFVPMPDKSPTIEELSAQIAELMPVVEQVNALQKQLADATTPAEAEAAANEAEEVAGETIEAAMEVEEAAAEVDAAVSEEEGIAALAGLDEKEKDLDKKAADLKPHAKSLDAAFRVGKAKAVAVKARAAVKAKGLDSRLKALEATAGDSAVVAIAARDTLARKLFPHVGVFDHAAMTAAQVAAYGAEKLGTTADKLDAFLDGRASIAPRISTAADSASTGAVSDYIRK